VTTLSEALAEGQGVERPFNCASPEHEDVNASASVNVVLGVWYCFSCGASGTIDGHVPTVAEALSVLKGETRPRVYAESWLDIFDAQGPNPYWTSRYGLDITESIRCGTHPGTGNPTYPLRDATGRVLGVVQRQSAREPKYLYPSGVRVSGLFFGDPQPRGTVILCEGASDVMAIYASATHHKEKMPWGWSVLGCFGAGIHAPQVAMLHDMQPRQIVLAFDADKAGLAAAERSYNTLSQFWDVKVHDWGTSGFKDPGDLYARTHDGSAMSDLLDTVETPTQKETGSDQ
jgi:hypothetical protein